MISCPNHFVHMVYLPLLQMKKTCLRFRLYLCLRHSYTSSTIIQADEDHCIYET